MISTPAIFPAEFGTPAVGAVPSGKVSAQGNALFQYFLGLELLDPQVAQNAFLEGKPRVEEQSADGDLAAAQNPLMNLFLPLQMEQAPALPKQTVSEQPVLLEPLSLPIGLVTQRGESKLAIPTLETPSGEALVASGSMSQEELSQKTNEPLKEDSFVTEMKTSEKSIQSSAISHKEKGVDRVDSPVEIAQVSEALPEKEILPSEEKSEHKSNVDGYLLSALVNGPEHPEAVRTENHGMEPAGSGHRMSVQELFNRVDALVQQGGGKMSIALNPPELGEVLVEVSARGNKISVEMTSKHDFARAVLETGLNDLRQSLHAQDLIVSKMEVNLASPEDLASWNHQRFNHLADQQSQSQRQGDSQETFGGERRVLGGVREVSLWDVGRRNVTKRAGGIDLHI